MILKEVNQVRFYNDSYNKFLTIDQKISFKQAFITFDKEYETAYSENMNKQRWQALNFAEKNLTHYKRIKSFNEATFKANQKKLEYEKMISIKFSKACKKDTSNMTIKELESYKKEVQFFLLKRLSLADNLEIVEIKEELSLIEKMIKKVDNKVFSLRAKKLLC
jgi:hypothetical protein